MKLKLYTLLFTGISLLVVACKTAGKMYQKGNYDEAVELAAKKLQKDPDDPKLLNIIQHSYRFAVNDHEKRISDLSHSNNELKWEWIYNEYTSLQRMYDAIFRIPAIMNIVKPVNYSSYLFTYSEKAADIRYQRAMAFMQHYEKESYQKAYRELQSAIRLKPGFAEARVRMQEAFEYAVTNVVILPIQQNGGFVYSSYTPGRNNLDDELIRRLQNQNTNDFVRFYSAWDARGKNIRTDQELDLNMVAMNLGRYADKHNRRRVSKQVIVKETVYKPDSIVREYKTVVADIVTTHRTMQSDALLQIAIRDEYGRRLWNDNIGATHRWETEFSSFTGDERALSENDRQLINRKHEFAPGENEIIRCLLDELTTNMFYRLRNYFNNL